MKDIFIIGSKGIPANYGGFETFVDKLTENKVSKKIKYHVACMADNEEEREYHNARCFNINVPNIGPAKAVVYDVLALKKVIEYIQKNKIENAIVYVLACRIGPFFKHYTKKLHRLGAKIYVNPDGHEWKRAKWNVAIKRYWKISEKLMIKSCDLAICDSLGIEEYIQETYQRYQPKTTFIAYGADVDVNNVKETQSLNEWYQKFDISKNNYYLIVGRFVPENNFETMIKEFMKSKTTRDLVIITNFEQNKFYDKLKEKTNFETDQRIKFVGTVYDQELLKLIRYNAYAYLHGHSVGGTNPSLLEAMALTNLNLLLNVNFNIEVGQEAAIYWGKQEGNLANIIDSVDTFSNEYIQKLGNQAKEIIATSYSWEYISNRYESLFLR